MAFVAAVINHFIESSASLPHRRACHLRADPAARADFLVLGTIFLGVATPTEGGAMVRAARSPWRWARRRLSFRLLKQAMDTTAKLTAFVVFILVGARVFSLTFYGVDGHLWVEAFSPISLGPAWVPDRHNC